MLLQRESELAEIERGIASSSKGAGGALLLEAAAGVGKSALLQAARAPAAAAGLTVLSARGGELEQAAAWAVARELLQPALRRLAADARDELLRGPGRAAGVVLGDEAVEEWAGPDQAFRIAHAMTWVVSALAQRAPLALLIDDAHWADRASLRWLSFLARRLDDIPVLLLAAARPIGQTDTELARLAVASRVVRPSPLDPGGVQALVAARLGTTPSEQFTLACHELTGGNPFLLGELLREAAADRFEPDASSAARLARLRPESVGRAVLLRLARLEHGALALARATAILGDGTASGAASALAGLSDGETLSAIEALTRDEVFARDASLRFVHPLVRAAIYSDLAPAHRAVAHQRAALLLSERGADRDTVVAQLLRGEPAAQPWAFRALLDSAIEARRRGAPEAAAELARRALAEPPPPDRRWEVLLELGRAQLASGEAGGFARLEAALESAPGETERVIIAQRLANAAILLGNPRRATEILSAQLGRIDAAREPSLASTVRAELIGAALHDPATLDLAREQLDLARNEADSPLRLDPGVLAPLACAEVQAGRADTGIAFAREALARSVPEADGYSSTLGFATAALRWAGQLEPAAAAWNAEVEDARRASAPLRLAWALSSRAQVLLRLGRVLEAEADARTTVELHEALLPRPVSSALATHAEALLEMDEGAEARAALARVKIDDDQHDLFPHAEVLRIRARVRAEDGDHAGALRDLERIARLARRIEVGNPDVMAWRPQAAVLHAAAGDNAYGITLAEAEAELASGLGARVSLAAALRTRGLLRRAEGLDDLKTAVDLLREGDDRLEYVRSLVDYGSAQRRLGHRAASRPILREALDLASAGGCAALARRAREELVASGARPRRDELRGRDSLTASERRVALLASEGRTNREIAQALFISLRTVETHLTHAYQKLNVRTRGELASTLR